MSHDVHVLSVFLVLAMYRINSARLILPEFMLWDIFSILNIQSTWRVEADLDICRTGGMFAYIVHV